MVSILASGSNSRRLTIAGVILSAVIIVSAEETPPVVYEFLDKHFVAGRPQSESVQMSGVFAKTALEILGQPYPDASATYWRGDGKTVWILSARGKTHIFKVGFVVKDTKICETDILVYNGPRGRGVLSGRFNKQFTGRGLKRGYRLDKHVHAISGATISSQSMINSARLSLAWTALLAQTDAKDETAQ